MSGKWIVIGLSGLTLALNAVAGPIEDATYAKLFDRAAGLLPGLTILERDLTQNAEARTGDHYGDQVSRELGQAGAWEITGGRRVEGREGIAAEASTNRVEFTWKVDKPRKHPELEMTLVFEVESAVPVRFLLQVGADDRFNRLGDWTTVDPKASKPIELRIPQPGRRDAIRSFGGVKLVFEGQELAGKKIAVKHPRLKTNFFEGFFRYEFEMPKGEIWEAVTEVMDSNRLYVNGKQVDDESIILPRPTTRGKNMYTSRRVPLKSHLKPGRNVLALRVMRTGGAPAAYLRGSVIMVSGERIPLNTGTNWVWNREAPVNWAAPDYDASGWMKILLHADMPREMGVAYEYKGVAAVASQISGFGFTYRPRGDMPCYDGLIKLRNPSDNQLFFNENAPFRLAALIPPGFKDGKPELAWEISRYAEGGTFIPVTSGKATEFKLEGDSLTASLEADKLARGIYVLTGRLSANGAVVEEREPEPLVVTGKVKMEQAAGDTWEQGLDLELENTVDFTDLKDPHPSFETDHKGPLPSGKWGTNYYHTVEPPLIVERNGLKYRTTRPISWAQFSYLVEFAHPGDWYLLALEYPDDAERWIGVSCNADRTVDYLRRGKPEERYSASSKCGPTIWTGGKYPNTGKMLEMKWLYRPDPGTHSINVMSLMKNTEAAAARLRIHHIKGRLPELDAGGIPVKEQRRFGMVTERTAPWGNGIYDLFSSIENRIGATNAVALDGDRGAGDYSKNAVVDGCEYLRLLEDAASHYAEYMRFAGQNVHAMGCFQYSDDNTAAQYLVGDPRIYNSSKNMLARVLAANDLMFYASVEYVSTERFAAAGDKPEWYLADRRGNRAMSWWAGKPLNLNFLHPEVEAEMLEVARQLAECFKYQPNFLGINWTTMLSGFFIPSYRTHTYPYNPDEDPLGKGYDDLTIGMFEKDTGIKVPGGSAGVDAAGQSNPEVCEKRYQFLTSAEMKPRWLAWRSDKLAQFFEKVTKTIRAARPGLETVAGAYLVKENISEWKYRQIPFQDYLDSWGWNPRAFNGKDGVWLMPWVPLAARYWPAARTEAYAFGWQANKDPDFYLPFTGLERRAIMLYVGWIEVERIAANYPYREGWPRPYQQTMMGQQREEMALEPYTQALIGFDPQMVIMGFTDQTPYIGVEGMQKKFARVLRRLPWGRFEPVLDSGFDSDFAIRALRSGNEYLFYVANPGYWPVKGTVTLAGAERVTDLVSGKDAALQDGAIAVELDPFGVAAFKAAGQEARVSGWTTEPPADAALAHMRSIIERAKTEAAKPGMADFLGGADYGLMTGTVAKAQQALADRRPAAAWAMLTEAPFWTVLFQKAPEIQFKDIVQPRALAAARVKDDQAPKIDGVLDDPVWQDAVTRPADDFVTRDKEYSKLQTTLRIARAGNRLFIAVECPDPEPDKIRGTTDKDNVKGTIWGSQDDLVAMFIMPEGNTPEETNYYQMAVTANGVKFEQNNRIRNGLHVRNYDYAPNWKAAVSRDKKGWSLEAEFDTAEAFAVPLRAGAKWQLNVHRQYRLNQFPVSSWTFNPGDWHSLKHMGTVTFE